MENIITLSKLESQTFCQRGENFPLAEKNFSLYNVRGVKNIPPLQKDFEFTKGEI